MMEEIARYGGEPGVHSKAARDVVLGSELHAVKTDGTGSVRLATDLFPYLMIQMAFQPWMFNADGQSVLYATAQGTPPTDMGLAAISAAGGSAVRLTANLFSAHYRASPRPDEQVTAVIASLRTGTRRATWTARGYPYGLAFLPDGRGFLFTHRLGAGSPSTLRFLRTPGENTEVLGSWMQTMTRSTAPLDGPFEVDPSGCVVLYDTDQELVTGTWLALVPR